MDNKYELVTRKQIVALFSIPKSDLNLLDRILTELENEGIIYLDDSKRYVPYSKSNLVKCRYQAKSAGFGFGLVEDGEDVYISAKNLNGAMNDDEILVEICDSTGRSREGKVVKILKRNVTQVIGRFSKSRNFGFVVPIDDSIEDIYISKKNSANIKDGQVVQVTIEKYPTNNTKAEGRITRIIGDSSDAHIDAKSLYISYGLDEMEKFNELVLEEIENIPDNVLDEEKVGRVDRTQERIYTIDSEDAKDLDDAISVKKRDNGDYLLSVYIADVSHYVKEHTPLDKEAIARGTSIYIPGKVIPMLPKKLSNGICSLNAGEERLSLAVDMLISKSGEVLSSEVFKAVIKVTKKMSYEKVYKVITNQEDDELIQEYGEYKQDLLLMEELARILNNKRTEEGCINFNIPETHIVLNENEDVETIEPYHITFANQIIEEFMLVTNMAVAEKYYFLELPFIYRIHEKPDEEKLRDLNSILANYKLRIKGIKDVHPKALSDILNGIENSEDKDIISTYMLRSLKLAKYSNECLGHFGLNAKYYCHFTSPIRRYPDLFIHRIISKALENKLMFKDNEIAKLEKQAEKYSKSSSELEKDATKIERDFDSLYSTLYMKEFIGEEFDARVSSITSFGIFVKLENTVEGFVSFHDIPGDYYIYDETSRMLIGKNTSKKYKIGDKLRVKLIKSDVLTKQIDFEVV
ncbi:MAG: ribonuclease R [Clostridia bacterium]|nr:ribonuclease R [Clostridia bacterium]